MIRRTVRNAVLIVLCAALNLLTCFTSLKAASPPSSHDRLGPYDIFYVAFWVTAEGAVPTGEQYLSMARSLMEQGADGSGETREPIRAVLSRYSPEDQVRILRFTDEWRRSSPKEWMPAFTTDGIALSSCRSTATLIGLRYRARDQTLMHIEPQQTIERMCTPDVLTYERQYNEALIRLHRTAHTLKHLGILTRLMETQLATGRELQERWTQINQRFDRDSEEGIDFGKYRGELDQLARDHVAARNAAASLLRAVYEITAALPHDLAGALANALYREALSIDATLDELRTFVVTARHEDIPTTLRGNYASGPRPDATFHWSPPSGIMTSTSRGGPNIDGMAEQDRDRHAHQIAARNEWIRQLGPATTNVRNAETQVRTEFMRDMTSELARIREQLEAPELRADPESQAILRRLAGGAPISGADLAALKAHSLRMTPGPARVELEGIQGRLASATPWHGPGRTAQVVGLEAVRESDAAFASGDQEHGNFYKEVAKAMLDIALDLTPYVGWAKCVYEAVTGVNIYGEPLSELARGMALFGAASGGLRLFGSATVFNSVRAAEAALARNAERVTRIIAQGGKITRFENATAVSHRLARAAQRLGATDENGLQAFVEWAAKVARKDPHGLQKIESLVHAAHGESRRIILFPRQLQEKFLRKAPLFGIRGAWNNANARAFEQAIEAHVARESTRVIVGTFRRQPAIHYVDPTTALNVVKSPAGQFLSGWKLNPKQLRNVLERGTL